MKFIFLSLLSFSISSIFAQNYLVSKTEATQRDGVFTLKAAPTNIILDCDSFLFGITAVIKKEKKFFHLYEQECYELYDLIQENSEKEIKTCLKLNFESKHWSYSKGPSDCL